MFMQTESGVIVVFVQCLSQSRSRIVSEARVGFGSRSAISKKVNSNRLRTRSRSERGPGIGVIIGILSRLGSEVGVGVEQKL